MPTNTVLRQATLDDSVVAVRLLTSVNPEIVLTVEGFQHSWASSQPAARKRSWRLDVEGECVGWATSSLMADTSEPGFGWIEAHVHPEHRGRGLGASLLEQAEQHATEIGVTRALSLSRGDDASAAFALSHGYEKTASNEILVVDPRTIAAPTLPAGVELRPWAAFSDDPSPIYHVDATSMIDEPGEARHDALTYETWLERDWGHPALDRDASMVALVDGQAAAVTLLFTDRSTGRGQNSGTGTLREHRGRGLATLAKQASLVRAAKLGCTTVYTGNDATNAPMLAINRKLGYEFWAVALSWGKTLAATS